MRLKSVREMLQGAIRILRRRIIPWDPDWQPRAGEKRHEIASDRQRSAIATQAEDAVARRLFWTGHRVLACNLRNRFGELDIVALRRKKLIFVEVRAYRLGRTRPILKIGRRKKLRLLRAAYRFRSRRPYLRNFDWTIRVAEVCFDDRGRMMAIRFTPVDYTGFRHIGIQ